MTPADIRARIHHAIIPALDRADRVIWELTAPAHVVAKED